ncbi:SurA N-terminal domain-containing protein [Desulfoprunum benzoelyticum]|uniref:Peptidyl-prolyl cis-trans isomerase SurA n=1 Tax=Desulfoprunum benzoelyticum TaxID=1506996 RepID=A0A840V2W0_9BACT|nr:peptidylprolyl isomerase [Desulfoprunum benzoelyticum]MBB5349168.1 peptidyl-prolyl cis-trans isomerase SurA [Desulfoprunum benzoelyticum]MBM9530595.1 SurA N-terminal domain-containing protein [Desulfoprunum benzoelyticum]
MKQVAHASIPARFFLLILFIFIVSTPHNGAAELVDRVVAVVNDDVITLSELEKEGERFYRDISAKTPATSLAETLQQAREHVLDRIIERRLIAQKAKAGNISVADAEVDAAFEQMLDQSRLSKPEFLARLKAEGLTETAYRENLRDQVLQSKVVNADVRSKVVITDEEILDYYDSRYTTQVSGGGFYLLQIGISWPKGQDAPSEIGEADRNKARKEAEKVLEMARDGEDFKALARKYSSLPSAADGGDIGLFQLEEMAPSMQQAVKDLKPDEISDIIETPEGYQFFKLLNNEDGTIVVKTPLEQVKEEIRSSLYEQRLKKAYDEWLDNLQNEAYIQKL